MIDDDFTSEEHVFLKPENSWYPKNKSGGSGGIPPTWIAHEKGDNDYTERRAKGITSLLKNVIDENQKKTIKDNMAYFIVDFQIKGDHPSCSDFLDKIRARVLTFLDDDKTKVLVTSDINELRVYAGFSASNSNIIYDIRPMRENEQIDSNILRNESWKYTDKTLNIFLMPNIENERLEKYIGQIRQFFEAQEIKPLGSMLEKFSKTGLITVKLDKPSTLKLLEKTSFIFRINETPQIDKESFGENNAYNTTENPTHSMISSGVQALPEVCVVDTGVNSILPLTNLISTKSREENIPDDHDYDNHGTPVAYLVAYGEGKSPRARIIAHKIVSGENESNLVFSNCSSYNFFQA